MALIYFATVTLLQSMILASGLIVMYIKQKSSLFNWSVKFGLAKNLLKDSWPLMLSGIAISIAMRIDQVMLKEYMGSIYVGYYAVSVRLAEAFSFIPMIIGQSIFPKVVNLDFNKEKKFLLLLFRVFFVLAFIAIIINFFSNFIILFLFGNEYSASIIVLNILIWTIPFTYFGIITNKILLSLNNQKLIFYKQLSLTILNVCLNIILIPKYGIVGAGLATLITDITINIFYECLFNETRWLFNLKIQSLLFIKGQSK
jgi:O-antigen/teichoic acid export membrane protein